MALDPYNFYLMNFKKLEQLVPQIRVEGRLIFSDVYKRQHEDRAA